MDSDKLAQVASKMGLPPGATFDQVMAAMHTDLDRRAATVGLPAGASLAQIKSVEQVVASAASQARKIAAAAATGHQVPVQASATPEPTIPATRSPRSTSNSIDYSAIMAEGDW